MRPEDFIQTLWEVRTTAILRAGDGQVARKAMEAAVDGGFDEVGRTVRRHDPVHCLVKEAGDMALPVLFRRLAQAIARRVHRETVGQTMAVGRVAAHPVAGLAGIGGDQLTLAFGRHAFQPDRQQLQFPRRLFQPRVDDARAIAVEIEKSPRQQRQLQGAQERLSDS